MTLVEFLKARLAEDEQAALNAQPGAWRYDQERFTVTCSGYPVASWRHEGELASGSPLLDRTGEYMERFDPARALAEVEARRRIVRAFESNDNYELYGGCGDDCEWGALDYALKALALPYADHPDYDPTWRP